MTVVDIKVSDDVRSLTKRLQRKNTKEGLAWEMSKIIKLAQNNEKTIPEGELWEILNRVLW
jgi:hypothetical protein